MTKNSKSLRTCEKGHRYYKSSSCPTCPVCANEQKPQEGFLSILSAPARRALENNGVTTLHKLSEYSEQDILKFHGMGPTSILKLRQALADSGLQFKS